MFGCGYGAWLLTYAGALILFNFPHLLSMISKNACSKENVVALVFIPCTDEKSFFNLILSCMIHHFVFAALS